MSLKLLRILQASFFKTTEIEDNVKNLETGL